MEEGYRTITSRSRQNGAKPTKRVQWKQEIAAHHEHSTITTEEDDDDDDESTEEEEEDDDDEEDDDAVDYDESVGTESYFYSVETDDDSRYPSSSTKEMLKGACVDATSSLSLFLRSLPTFDAKRLFRQMGGGPQSRRRRRTACGVGGFPYLVMCVPLSEIVVPLSYNVDNEEEIGDNDDEEDGDEENDEEEEDDLDRKHKRQRSDTLFSSSFSSLSSLVYCPNLTVDGVNNSRSSSTISQQPQQQQPQPNHHETEMNNLHSEPDCSRQQSPNDEFPQLEPELLAHAQELYHQSLPPPQFTNHLQHGIGAALDEENFRIQWAIQRNVLPGLDRWKGVLRRRAATTASDHSQPLLELPPVLGLVQGFWIRRHECQSFLRGSELVHMGGTAASSWSMNNTEESTRKEEWLDLTQLHDTLGLFWQTSVRIGWPPPASAVADPNDAASSAFTGATTPISHAEKDEETLLQDECCLISHLWIAPAHRGSGWGHALAEKASRVIPGRYQRKRQEELLRLTMARRDADQAPVVLAVPPNNDRLRWYFAHDETMWNAGWDLNFLVKV